MLPESSRVGGGLLYICGAGGLGREVHDAATAAGLVACAFLDDALAGTTLRGLPVLAPGDAESGADYVIGIADPRARRRLAAVLDLNGLNATIVVHPRAVVAPDVSLSRGVVILANACVSVDVLLRDHVQVHYNATVGHDATLLDFATVYPAANVAGSVTISERATVGSNACVLQGRTIGSDGFVGAGAVVTKDVPAGVTVTGCPARPVRSGGEGVEPTA